MLAEMKNVSILVTVLPMQTVRLVTIEVSVPVSQDTLETLTLMAVDYVRLQILNFLLTANFKQFVSIFCN